MVVFTYIICCWYSLINDKLTTAMESSSGALLRNRSHYRPAIWQCYYSPELGHDASVWRDSASGELRQSSARRAAAATASAPAGSAVHAWQRNHLSDMGSGVQNTAGLREAFCADLKGGFFCNMYYIISFSYFRSIQPTNQRNHSTVDFKMISLKSPNNLLFIILSRCNYSKWVGYLN